MIDREIVEEIKNEASIVQIINTFIPLTKKGQNYVGVCPFHDDHTPSLSVNEQKKIYKCFSCGSGGNVFTFVKEYTKCSYQEAIIKVAEMMGKPLEIDNHKSKRDSPFKHLHDVMRDSISFSTYALRSTEGTNAKEYLNKRGLTNDIIDYFDIGYMPKGDIFIEYLEKKGHSDINAEKVGLIREAKNEVTGDFYFYNVFSNRITFPIHDSYGNPIAYSARALEDGNFAKYLNTGETDIFHKGKVVYNLHRAFSEARHTNYIYVCEGVMDVIALKRADIGNAVATLGTACSKDQLQLCGKATENIVFFYDGDKAGRNATMRAIELSLSLGLKPSVVLNNTGKDPDEIISTSGSQSLKDLVSKKINGIEYAFDYYKNVYPLDNYNDRKAYMQRLSPLIDLVKDDYDRNYFEGELRHLTGLPLEKDSLEINLRKTLEATESLEKSIDIKSAKDNVLLQEVLEANKVLQEKINAMPDYGLKVQERRNEMAKHENVLIRFPEWAISKPYEREFEDKTSGEVIKETMVNIKMPDIGGNYGATFRSFSVAQDRIYNDKQSDNMRYILKKPETVVRVSTSILDPQKSENENERSWINTGFEEWTPQQIADAFVKNLENFKARSGEQTQTTPEVETEAENTEGPVL